MTDDNSNLKGGATKCVVKTPRHFSNLHSHSTFSVNDAVGMPQENLDWTLENGGDAMALTEHGNMSSYAHAYLHEQELAKQGRRMKYLPGVEAYFHPDLGQWACEKAAAEELRAGMKKRSKKLEAEANDEDASVEGTDGVENEAASKTNKHVDPVKRRHHLVLLAKSSKGLKNLFTLVSRANKEGYYKFPRIDYRMLKEHGEDIIVSSACCAGLLSFDILSTFPEIDWDNLGPETAAQLGRDADVQRKLKNSLDRLVDCVGRENVFLELQFNSLKPQHLINQHLITLSRSEGMPLVATADSHYCRPEYWQSREIYKKLGWLNYEKYDPSLIPQSVDELKCELYPKNAEQMWESYKRYGSSQHSFYDDDEVCDAIERTHDIAWQMIGDVSPDRAVKLPAFVAPKGRDECDILREFVREGMNRLNLSGIEEYEARLNHELRVIEEKQFSRYFLLMKAIIDLAWEHMIVGPGRGSSAGSLVCYCLNITQIDPLKYGLLFDRFVNPARNELPDIDSDVADRDLLVQLMKQKFGEDNVLPITNYNTFKLNSLVRDLSRFYGLEFTQVNSIMKRADAEVRKKVLLKGDDKNTYEMTYEHALEHSTGFREFIDDNPDVGKHISVLFKQNKSLGRHAGGVIVSENILEQMPVIKVRGELQTPWVEGMHAKHLDKFGWIKVDILGLDTLRIVQRTIERILIGQGVEKPTFTQVKAWYDENMHPSKLDLDDQDVYERVYGRSKYAGTFQCTSAGSKKLFKEGKPKSIVDIAALTALFRPGPLAMNADKAYLKARNDPSSVVYVHPLVKKVLGETHGQLVFQEQMLKLGADVGGMSPVDCDRLRKALTKKEASAAAEAKRKKELVYLHSTFIAGAKERGFTDEAAEHLFDAMSAQSGYSFNLAHSVSYAIDSYYCAWLLVHHEPEWLCSYIESQIGNPDKRANAMSELQSFGYTVVPIDVNLATDRWRALEGKQLMPSFQTIKGLGAAAVEEILAERPYNSIQDFLWRPDGSWRHSKLNKKSIDALIKLGAFGSLDCVGKCKVFENYAHMHAVVVDRMAELRNRKLGRSAFDAIVEEGRSVDPWLRAETMQFCLDLIGYFDASAALDERIRAKLDELGVVSLDEHDGSTNLHWFIITSALKRLTKNGKDYQVLNVACDTGQSHRVFCWGASHSVDFPLLVPCVAEVSKSDFGFATSMPKLKIVGKNQ